jgi:hypothetical protein
MTGHALTRENTTRILRHTDGTRRVVRHRVTMGCTVGTEVVALDTTLETLTDRGTGHINLLPFGKNGDSNLIASLETSQLISFDQEFLEHMPGFDTRLGQMASEGLETREARRLPNAT